MTEPRRAAVSERTSSLSAASRADAMFYGLLAVTAVCTLWTIHAIFLEAPTEL